MFSFVVRFNKSFIIKISTKICKKHQKLNNVSKKRVMKTKKTDKNNDVL